MCTINGMEIAIFFLYKCELFRKENISKLKFWDPTVNFLFKVLLPFQHLTFPHLSDFCTYFLNYAVD